MKPRNLMMTLPAFSLSKTAPLNLKEYSTCALNFVFWSVESFKFLIRFQNARWERLVIRKAMVSLAYGA